MIFNSFEFLFLFLPLAIALYLALNHWASHYAGRVWLTVASVFFYAWWDARFVALLAASVLFNYVVGKQCRSRAWLVAGITGNLAALVYFKYAGFFFGATGIVLPLGISFFTFTQIAYLVDVHRRDADPAKYGFIDYALFVTYFPHLLAGPILHHGEMLPQFVNSTRATFSAERFAPGLALLAAGLAKKVLIADQLSPFVATGFGNLSVLNFSQSWLTALAYTAQIYFDFSGYTDMARGMSKMLNIELPINFNSPYQARNLQDFWQRWHITLSRFLRDYLFFPIGGARHPYVATLITFAVAGLWHGANWTFIVWGILNGVGVVLARLWPYPLPALLARALTFLSVTWLWVWFRAANLTDAWVITKAMLQPAFTQAANLPSTIWLLAIALPIAWLVPNTQKLFERQSLTPAWRIALGLLLALSVTFLQHATEFLYFNF
ncbi:alginate O-acetyltransferase [Bryobacterales bacterium F-183]|nr:alginate O-acetyltransferase [Bryobacterales bacterium F-183]